MFIPKDRRSLFRQFLAGMYDAVVITDPNGHIIEVNPRTVEYFGRDLDEVLDQPISIYIPGLRQDVVNRIRRGLEGDRHVVIDASAVTREGKKIACEVAVSVIDLMNPGDLIFTIRNVERRREYLTALRSKANAFKVAQTALFACDESGRFIECNPAFVEIFGLESVEDAKGRVFTDFMSDAPLPENFKKALNGETTVADIVAEDDEDSVELEIVLAPNTHSRKIRGVVGSILKV